MKVLKLPQTEEELMVARIEAIGKIMSTSNIDYIPLLLELIDTYLSGLDPEDYMVNQCQVKIAELGWWYDSI
jgi:hypothetical protein